MSHRSEVATSGSIPMAACSAACAAPGMAASATPARAQQVGGEGPPHGLGRQRARGQVQGMLADDLARRQPSQERGDLGPDLDVAEVSTPTGPHCAGALDGHDVERRHRTRLGRPAGVADAGPGRSRSSRSRLDDDVACRPGGRRPRPGGPAVCDRASSMVPRTRPVRWSTIRSVVPEPRSDTRSVGRSPSAQNQPVGRRRSTPEADETVQQRRPSTARSSARRPR